MSLLVAMSGSDTIYVNNRLLTGLADDNVAELKFAADIAGLKTGKNGNSLFALNTTGLQADLTLRLLRGCPDDIFILGLLNSQLGNFAGFPLMTAVLTKVIGDGTGATKSDTYPLSGGIFMKQPEAESNVTGDTKQSVVVYTMKFSNSARAIA